jgi:hypothetical protein
LRARFTVAGAIERGAACARETDGRRGGSHPRSARAAAAESDEVPSPVAGVESTALAFGPWGQSRSAA